jgi:hypothetical protein
VFLALELITGNLVEPRLYGTSTGISNVAMILAAIFWTSLWGSVGLILSTPLTVCLVVMGRYLPQLAFLSVLLGKEAVLTPEERLYQRMLAGDVEGGEEIAKEELRNRPLASLYDDVLLPALRLPRAIATAARSTTTRTRSWRRVSCRCSRNSTTTRTKPPWSRTTSRRPLRP